MIVPNQDPPLTDAQCCAFWAAQALQEGRIELGRALANLAAQAQRIEARMVPMIGQTREERPRAETPPAAEVTGNGDADLARAEAAQTQIFGRPPDLAPDVPDHDRCSHPIQNALAGMVNTTPCHVVVWWDSDHGVWHHIEPNLDHDHAPVVVR